MRPPFFYPPQYAMNAYQMPQMPQVPQAPQVPQMPYQSFSPFGMRPPIPMQAPVPAPPTSSMPRLDSFLQGADSLFTGAQKFTPYFQQAAPMFKNLPALWRMYKGFKQAPGDEDESSFSLESSLEDIAPPPRQRRSRRPDRSAPEQRTVPLVSRPSVPRIYQPPLDYL